jgi:REP element-mobilizing transposase RayT
VYKFFDVMKADRNHVLAFVIMPNHVHLLVHYTNTKQSLNTAIGNGKRFIGYGIVSRLQQQDQAALLIQMKEAVRLKDRKIDKKHQIWQGTFDVKQCRTEKFILQKFNYIHNNPCLGRWNLCEKPYQYPYSSVRFYDGGKTGYQVKDYLDILVELNCRDQ